jgi:hypothetical protein
MVMARIEGVSNQRASLFARFVFLMSRRRLGKVIAPLRIKAHHPRLLRGYAHMELAQQTASTIPMSLKALVDVRVARLIGCPF